SFGVAGLSHGPPPAPDRIHRKAGGVAIGADADPTNVVADVIDAVRHGAAELGIDKVVNLDQFGHAFIRSHHHSSGHEIFPSIVRHGDRNKAGSAVVATPQSIVGDHRYPEIVLA